LTFNIYNYKIKLHKLNLKSLTKKCENFTLKSLNYKKRNKATSRRKMEVEFLKNLESETSKEKIQDEEKNVSKNKWLYPSDEFGQMEKGVEYDSNTYIYEKFDKENDFEIL
jgi:hypothetical protein